MKDGSRQRKTTAAHSTHAMLEDDARLLLPPQQPNYDGSEADWIASPTSSGCSIDMLAADESFSEYSSDSASPPCDLGTIERLLRTHPVWFLPDIQRAGAVHLLQSKEHGSFVVRGSSQANTMAVSVRLPPGTGPYIEHYLIQSNQGVLSLETSKFKFDSIPALIAHYSQCCDELPVQLRLPQALRDATNRKQLSSLSLLGQEFWRYSMNRSHTAGPNVGTHGVTPHIASSPTGVSGPSDSAIDVKGVTSPLSPSDTTFNSKTLDSPGDDIQITQCNTKNHHTSAVPRRKPFGQPALDNGAAATVSNNNNHNNAHTIDLLSPTLANSFGTFCQIDTPSDTMSSISSFTSAGLHCVLQSPTGSIPRPEPNGNNQHDDRLRSRHRMSLDLDRVLHHTGATDTAMLMTTSTSSSLAGSKVTRCVEYQRSSVRTRPTPPNTLNLICFEDNINLNATQTTRQPAMFAPAADCDTPSSSSFGHPSHLAARTGAAGILSPDSLHTPSSTSSFGRPAKRYDPKLAAASRQPKHYQESNILEYCRSPLADKISDYEDLPSRSDSDKIYQSTLSHGPLMSSFRSAHSTNGASATPRSVGTPASQRPDLLHEIRTVTSLSENILMPGANGAESSASSSSSAASSASSTPAAEAGEKAVGCDASAQMVYVKPVNVAVVQTPTLSDSKECSPFYAEPANSLNVPLPPLPALQSSFQCPARNPFPPPLPLPLITKTLATPLPSPLDADRPLPIMLQAPPAAANRAKLQHAARLAGQDAWSLDSSWMFMNTDEQHLKNGADDDDDDDDDAFNNTAADTVTDADYDTDEHWHGGGGASLSHLASRPYPSSTAETAKVSGHRQHDTSTMTQANATLRASQQTVQQLILARMPELSAKLSGAGVHGARAATLCVDNSAALVRCFRISSYDNVTDRSHAGFKHSILQLARSGASSSVHSDDGTVFSEPWDSSQWDTLSLNQCDSSSAATPLPAKSRLNAAVCLSEGDTITEEETYPNTVIDNLADASYATTTTTTTTTEPTTKLDVLPAQKLATIMRSRNRLERGVLNHPRNKLPCLGGGGTAGNGGAFGSGFLCSNDTTTTGVGATIAEYAYALAADAGSTFARNIQNFITCTRESRELTPQVIMRNMRQFMSGMKNYLVKHGEGEFQNEVLRARARLRSDEFLNLDQILEGVMHRLVVVPLRQHLYALSVEHYVQSGQIQLLVENVRHAAARPAADFGIPASVEPPSAVAMQRIGLLLQRLQEAELPLDKLSYLLTVVAAIFETANSTDAEQILGADYFLPLLVYVVAKCEFIGAEVEAEFMYGLLQQSLLTGEAGYYLTALCSAVEVLKGMMAHQRVVADGTAATAGDRGRGKAEAIDTSTLPACSSVLRVIIPDELNGSLQTCTLPVRPNTTTKEVCRSIAHKARITNPQDYALFELIDGEETLMTDAECPQESRLAARGQHCLFAYKRIEAKIAWPTLPNPV